MNQPVKESVVMNIVEYMKSMPIEHESLVLQCAEHLNKDHTLAAVLAVTHALNEVMCLHFLLFLQLRDKTKTGRISS